MKHLRSVAADEDDVEELTTRPVLDSGKLRSEARLSVGRREPPSEDSDSGPMHRSSRLSASLPVEPMQENTRLGPYQLVCELASGGMATVYLALYRSIEGFEKLCAVKRIHPHLAGERAFADMFVDEARIAARISHPFVCSVFSFGKSHSSHYIAMEFLRGEPLSALSRRVARTPALGDDPRFPSLAARLLANFAEGLHAAHTLRDEHGAALEVVHRDVTPQNLFVMYDGSVRVTDFGIAHARRRLHQTEGQKLKGKLSYIAPEQLNEGPVDLRVDVWGLGVVLWELLAGRRLFLGSNEGETLSAVMSRVVRAPSCYRASVPADLDRIVLRALERDVNKRYRSARDMARDLERFLSSCGDAVPAMDVADWMAQVFPQGAERIQALGELASRVSANTAEDTVMRVPSSPPAHGVLEGLRLFPTPAFASQPPTKPDQPMAAVRPEPAVLGAQDHHSSQTPLRVVTPVADVDEPAPARPRQPSRPRLQLEEQSDERDLAAPARASGPRRRWQWAAIAATIAAVASGVVLLREPRQAPSREVRTVVSTPAAAGNQVRAAVDALPLEIEPVLVASERPPVVSPPPSARGKTPVAGTKPTPTRASLGAPLGGSDAAGPAAADMGDIMITTPGGSWEVSEHGRVLGKTPASFRLSAGQHELTLKSGGTEHRLVVRVVKNAPTVVTLPLSR